MVIATKVQVWHAGDFEGIVPRAVNNGQSGFFGEPECEKAPRLPSARHERVTTQR